MLGEGGGRTVAMVMTKAALLEQMLTSGSTAMIFLTRVTGRVVSVCGKGGRRREGVRGSWVWPVTSFLGGMAVVL
jgi:hypothetical protein